MFAAIFSNDPSPTLDRALRQAGVRPIPVQDAAAIVDQEPDEGWSIAVVEVTEDPTIGLAVARRIHDEGIAPVLICAPRTETTILANAVCDDFVLIPTDVDELAVRIARLIHRHDTVAAEVIMFKELSLNLATYQATLGSEPIDLTYMEYELLRFFATHPTRVWSREQLLSRVWGYDYFGGARTVDVHVRRLRAKLGEERASWITTVRSVGYRFG
jgi:two-component system alkaline phosphatase synthesis response regulator PhoP